MWMLLGLIALVAICALVHAASRAPHREDERPGPCTALDPRCIELSRKQYEARERMRALGIPLLLGDRAPWARASGGAVVAIRRAT